MKREREKKKRLRKRFSKDREAIKDIGGFRFRGCLRISNPCGIITREREKKKKTRGSKCAILNKYGCADPLETKRGTIFTHVRVLHRVRGWLDRWLKNAATHRWKPLKPLLSLSLSPPSYFPPFILMNGNRSGFRVCNPLSRIDRHEEGG